MGQVMQYTQYTLAALAAAPHSRRGLGLVWCSPHLSCLAMTSSQGSIVPMKTGKAWATSDYPGTSWLGHDYRRINIVLAYICSDTHTHTHTLTHSCTHTSIMMSSSCHTSTTMYSSQFSTSLNFRLRVVRSCIDMHSLISLHFDRIFKNFH